MAKKTLVGLVVSTKMQGSVVVEITRKQPHPKYKKLLKVSKKFVADLGGKEVKEGDMVKLVETPKRAKNKFFIVEEIIK
ncbi:MAG TPA: 30S ribosomal protein S17 [Candidatus Saccharimonadales bacterium]|nr:30S ribosomal protein S17 [Candidatus Saccharimonadales bacterium]